MPYTKEDLIKDTQPIFESLMWSEIKALGKLVNKYEEDNPGKFATVKFHVDFGEHNAQEETV